MTEHPFLLAYADLVGVPVENVKSAINEPAAWPYEYVITQNAAGQITQLNLDALPGVLARNSKMPWDDRRPFEARVRQLALEKGFSFALVPELEDLVCISMQLRELDLRCCPRLKYVRCSTNVMQKLDVSTCLELEILDASTFDHLEGADADVELELHLPTNNNLKKVTLEGPRRASVDLSMLTKMQFLRLHFDGLQEIIFPEEAPLEELLVNKVCVRAEDVERFPRLKFLSLHGTDRPIDFARLPNLEVLFASEMGMEKIDTSQMKRLHYLDVRANRIAELDLSHNPLLENLSVKGNPLPTLDIRHNLRLNQVLYDPKETGLITDPLQALWLPFLRKGQNFTKDALTTMRLHDKAREYNWDDGEAGLFKIIRNPRCDKATALFLYWLGQPRWYFEKYPSPKDVEKGERPVYRLLKEIEAKVQSGFYTVNYYPFDPKRTDGTALMTDEDAASPLIPEFMRQLLIGIRDLDEVR